MARRRRGTKIEELIGPVVGLIFLLIFSANGFNIQRTTQMMQGLFALIVYGVITIGVCIILFFVIRYFVRKNRDGRSSFSVRSMPGQPNRQPTDSQWKAPAWATAEVRATPQPYDFVARLRATDWYQFEKVVGFIYEAQGYGLKRRGGAKPDGGIDLVIEKDGERAAVQCKRWKKWKVDVPKVRELFGAMTHEGLTRGVMVALNGFTIEAKQLAVEHNIDIVHVENLATMIAGLSPADQLKVQAMLDDETKHCPKCEASMVWRKPKPGRNWTPFWGCSRYPQCYGRLQED